MRTLTALANQQLSLRKSTVVRLDIQANPGESFQLTVPVNGELLQLDLWPHSVRSPLYQVLVQGADGLLTEVEPGPIRTLRGVVVGLEGSEVAASLEVNGITLTIRMPTGENYSLQPIDVPGGDRTLHAVYSDLDIIAPPMGCGVGPGDVHIDPVPAGDTLRGPGMPCGGDLCIAEIACDADVEFYVRHGQSVILTEDAINAVMNQLNIWYENQVGIVHEITTIIVRTAEPDPYSSTVCGTLLGQLQNYWNANHGGIQRDTAQLFTHKTLSDCAGIAFLSTICNLGSAYSVAWSECCGNNINIRAQLSAHELAHNWSANHCDPTLVCANCSCGFNIMRCAVNGSTTFSSCELPSMMAFRDTRTCLEGLNVPPFNNDCPDRQLIAASTRPINTVNATMDGTDPDECDGGGGLQIDNDIWYCYVSICDGTGTVDLCNLTDFDTRVAVYAGCTCPATNDRLLSCNDNGCDGPGSPSLVEFPTTFGAAYLIRIGGPEEGTGEMTVSCVVGGGEEDANILDVKSLLTHGAGPGIELAIDLDDSNGIEPRQGGVQKVSVQMSENMEVGTVTPANVQVVCAVGPAPVVSNVTLVNGDTVVVELATAMADLDCCTLSFAGMETDTGGVVLDDFSATSLAGDLDFNGAVTGGDSLVIKPHFGEQAGMNLNAPQWDYERNGGVTGGDYSLIKPLFGHIPAAPCP